MLLKRFWSVGESCELNRVGYPGFNYDYTGPFIAEDVVAFKFYVESRSSSHEFLSDYSTG